MKTRIGQLEVTRSARGVPSYRLELWHDGLKKHRLIKGAQREVVQRKAQIQVAEWEAKWFQTESREQARQSKEGEKRQKEANKQFAAELSAEAQRELDRLANILRHTLGVNDAVDWDRLKDHSDFPEPKPTKPLAPPKPNFRAKPEEPVRGAPTYQPKLGFLDRLIGSRRDRLTAECQARFNTDHLRWKETIASIDAENAAADERYKAEMRAAEQQYDTDVREWERRKAAFLEQQRLSNEVIDRQRAAYMSGSPEAVVEYCDMVLSASDYPDYFPKEYSLDYNPDSKILVVDYSLPPPESIPTVKEVKYIASRDELVEQHLSQSQVTKLYDDLLYQIPLRTVHELFEADVVGAIGTIVFNGIVTSVDRSTGKEITACILSLQAQRDEFLAINLANVDPKACFKSLKGVGSSKLHSLAAVPPIMQIRRDDGRFVSAYEVANTLDESSNLAAMDWEDFEHLIREVFEQEFSSSGGEVKVTQASRDGGVDAVAFDPDPIRGGKIVIQAKRYTNTVGVGAVRDLYGTVMNEGANKGILVTTSDYGPDAYAFANGKPLVLLNGANLLHMLQKHGHKARIDVQEARRIAMGQPAR